ncbi:hypothetical protein CRUP_031135 [Coryphaenoides rupestris]|nr:hypothetical protein CRUP_031135 [Coryphaenoides rupestris]
MISTATRTTATVSPLSPLTNGNTVAQSANSGFAAALRKLAKQAEDPRGCSLSIESSPVSSPATSHSSPGTTPKRGSSGPHLPGLSRGQGRPGTPPVVPVAPIKSTKGLWRAEGGQSESPCAGSSQVQQDKRSSPLVSPHPLLHPFGLTPSTVIQDPRMQSHSLPGQMHPVVPSGAVPEEYLRGLRPFPTPEDLRLSSLPLGLDPTTAAHAAAAYYHPAYLHHPLALHSSTLCLQGAPSPLSTPLASTSTYLEHAIQGSSTTLLWLIDKGGKEQEHPSLPPQKPPPQQHGLQSSLGSIPYPVPSLVPSHMGKHQAAVAAAAGLHGQLAAAMMSHRAGEEGWLSRQRRQDRHDREGPPELCLRLPGKGVEPRREVHRVNSVQQHSINREANPRLGGPPPLISPKTSSAHPSHPPRPPHPPTTLWNPASLVNTPMDCHHKAAPPGPPGRPPPGLTRADRAPSWSERPEEGERSRAEGPERYPATGGSRGTQEQPGFWINGEQHRASSYNLHNHHHHPHHQHQQQLHQHHHHPPRSLHQGSPKTLPAGPITGSSSGSSSELQGPGLGVRERIHGVAAAPRSLLVYDEALQQHRLLLSKLDLVEKRRREAREGGYYYDLEESYDESDEEEVKAHLRRVTQQPPLKLDASSEKVEFLGVLGLTTQRHRLQILERKRRKRRRMMRERSPPLPPPPSTAGQGKKKGISAALTTPYTALQMDSSPKLEEKKDFLQMFSLAHVTPQQRRDKEQTEGLLRAIQKKTSNGQSYPDSPGSSPPHSHPINNHRGDPFFKPNPDTQIPRHPLPALMHAGDKTASKNTPLSTKKPPQPQGGLLSPAPRKEPAPGLQNSRSRPWEKFTPEAFAQQFHHAVLQSTHNTLQSNGVPEVNMKANPSLPLNMSSSMKRPRLHSSPPRPAYHNGHHPQYPGARRPPASREHLSEEEDERGESGQDDEDEEDEDETEVEDAPRRWSGIEAIFEAYQEYTEEWSVERQVLHSQCKRLEAQNHTLTRTAEQMSVTMGELVGQRQRVREERERLQAQLEHFRRCLTLPSISWGRGQVSNSHGGPSHVCSGRIRLVKTIVRIGASPVLL